MPAVLAMAFHAPPTAKRSGVLNVEARGHQSVTRPFDLVIVFMLRMQSPAAGRSNSTTDQWIGAGVVTSVLPRTTTSSDRTVGDRYWRAGLRP
jgi:hypothetical protein